MQRWQLCLALTLASVMSAPVAEAAVSPGDGRPQIVAGRLVDAADRPQAGAVELFAWPTGKPVQIGQTVALLPVGYARAAEDGRFSLRGGTTSELAELADLNGGYVNFVLQATSAGVTEELHFSRYLGDARFTAQEATGRPKFEWRASPEDPAEPVEVTMPESPRVQMAAGDRPITPMQGGCTGLKKIDSHVAHTVIGELRTPDDTVEASLTYGERADSEIGVATRGAYGPWSASGSFHVANADETEITQRARSGQHLLVRSRFMYDKFEHRCPSGRREKVVPQEWMGDVQSEPTAVHGCASAPEGRLGRFTPDTEFRRNKEKAVRWDGAASVFGASLSARSGYSRWVRGHWKFGSGAMHLLCGNDGPPKRASHIFAGTSA